MIPGDGGVQRARNVEIADTRVVLKLLEADHNLVAAARDHALASDALVGCSGPPRCTPTSSQVGGEHCSALRLSVVWVQRV